MFLGGGAGLHVGRTKPAGTCSFLLHCPAAPLPGRRLEEEEEQIAIGALKRLMNGPSCYDRVTATAYLVDIAQPFSDSFLDGSDSPGNRVSMAAQ
jgi:hypothetical protein